MSVNNVYPEAQIGTMTSLRPLSDLSRCLLDLLWGSRRIAYFRIHHFHVEQQCFV
jgi:hypothetical protein